MPTLAEKIVELTANNMLPIGIVVVDHGSRRAESNDLLLAVAQMFCNRWDMSIVEPAHMELAEPSIAAAMDRCVEQGAKTVVVFPYFLSPGRHWSEDIPRLAAEAAQRHPHIRHLVTAPLGLHELLADVAAERIVTCLGHHTGDGPPCDLCDDDAQCQLR